MADPSLPLLEDAAQKLAPFLKEIVFIGGVTLGLLITDEVKFHVVGQHSADGVEVSGLEPLDILSQPDAHNIGQHRERDVRGFHA